MKTPFIKQYDKPSDELKSKMKIAISKINIGRHTIGPSNGEEFLNKNITDGYDDTLFSKMLESKIEQDYKVIKDGLDLLTFYLEHNPEIHQFDFDINKIQTIINTRNTLC